MQNDSVYAFVKEGVDLYIRGKISAERMYEGIEYLSRIHNLEKVSDLFVEALRDINNSRLYTQHELQSKFNEILEMLYAKISHPVRSQTREFQIKYPPLPLDMDYNINREQIENQGTPTMLGRDYVRQQYFRPGSYSYLREMLQTLWDRHYTSADKRFVIDLEFNRDCKRISDHIAKMFTDNQIDNVHTELIQRMKYRGRGRPRGALNRRTLENNTSITTPFDNIDMNVIDVEPNTFTPEVKVIVPQLPAPNVTQPNINLDDYAKKDWVQDNFTHREAHTSLFEIVNRHDQRITILDSKVQEIADQKGRYITLKPLGDLPEIELGVQHREFETLLTTCRAINRSGSRLIPWVYGPAGTGKSTAAKNVARVLTPGRFFFRGKTLLPFDVMGFINTSGYHRTPFREAYENGGTFCAEELDSWSPDASIALNNAIENGEADFPDGIIKRHPDFVIIACANTVGQGATLDYAGRNKQDAATLNRFVFLEWPLDEVLEDALCANKDWLHYVRNVRANVEHCNIMPKPIISPRQSIQGEALLHAGIEWRKVVDMVLRRGLNDTNWDKIR